MDRDGKLAVQEEENSCIRKSRYTLKLVIEMCSRSMEDIVTGMEQEARKVMETHFTFVLKTKKDGHHFEMQDSTYATKTQSY